MAQYIFTVDEATQLLANGEVVALPTETVYGLAGCLDNPLSIDQIYHLKNRPSNKALSVNIHASWDINKWCGDAPQYVKKLTSQFWPGPLTIIARANPANIPKYLFSPNNTIAMRCPNHPLTIEVLAKLGKPLVAPSANPSGKISPTLASQVMDYFQAEQVYILDGGACQFGIESTILAAIDENNYQILRCGAISVEKICTCVGFMPSTIASGIFDSKLPIPMYSFTNRDELVSYIQKNSIENYLCIASESTIRSYNFKNQLLLPQDEHDYKRTFYTILSQAQAGNYTQIFIEYPATSPELQTQINRYAQPIILCKNR